MNILQPVFKLFGRFLMLLYTGTHSYILALVIFTLLIKLVLFPLSIKSKKSMMKTQSLQGKMQDLQKQYGKDKERYNQEVQKLYETEGVNPMGGCLWTLLPLPILWGVYAVVRRPLFFMYNLTADQVTAVEEAVQGVNSSIGELTGRSAAYLEMKVANLLNTDPASLEAAKTALGDAATKLHTTINFKFLGINLSETPNLKFWANGISWNSIGLFIIPLIVVVVSYLSTYISTKTNAINQGDEKKPMDANTRSMMIMMPLMYLWFGYIMPAGMCIYMLVSMVFQIFQEMATAKLLRSKFMEQQAKKEEEERQRKLEEKRQRAEKIAQRQKEEEEAKKKRRKAAAVQEKSNKGPTTDKGAVGIRRYAKGRNYEPDRFGGVTPYRDPTDVIDEAAVEEARRKKKSRKGEEAAEEVAETAAELPETAAKVEEAAAEVTETVEEVAETAADETGSENKD